jgi:RNA polymerase sigma-70 factor (ECF subfamily)
MLEPVCGSEGAPSMAEPSLNALMEKYAAGDEAAFSALYDGLAPRLYGFLRRQTRDQALAEDLLQQTLLQIHRARGRYLPGADVLPWAFAIARRLVIDWHRSHHREVLPEQPEELSDTGLPGTEAQADELVQARQMANEVEQVLARLPENQRVAYQLIRHEGLSVNQAAEMLGTTVPAVKLRAHRAYVAIRSALVLFGVTP